MIQNTEEKTKVSKEAQEKLVDELLSNVRKYNLSGGSTAYAVLDINSEKIIWSGTCERGSYPLINTSNISISSGNPFLSRQEAKQYLSWSKDEFRGYVNFE